MDCQSARKLMDKYMDGTISRRELAALSEHVRNCPKCHEELETDYLVAHAGEILDNPGRDSFDLKKMVDEDLARRSHMMRRRIVTGILIWALIIILAVVIVALCVSLISPGTMRSFLRGVRNFFNIQFDWQFWRDFSTSAVS